MDGLTVEILANRYLASKSLSLPFLQYGSL